MVNFRRMAVVCLSIHLKACSSQANSDGGHRVRQRLDGRGASERGRRWRGMRHCSGSRARQSSKRMVLESAARQKDWRRKPSTRDDEPPT